jgi:antitoxin FitA
MGQVLIRNLDDKDLEGLRQLARQHHRSLEAEIRLILKEAAARAHDMNEFRSRVEAIRASFGGKLFSDSAEMIREDREIR